jgi:hypothetical protein
VSTGTSQVPDLSNLLELAAWTLPAPSLLAGTSLAGGTVYTVWPSHSISCHLRPVCCTGQAFGKHIDESNELGAGLYTQYTLLVYLSRCSGGETIFYGERVSVAMIAKMCDVRCHPRVPVTCLAFIGPDQSPSPPRACAGNRNRRLATVVPQPGLALLHRHGDECLEHEGAAVTGGTKYVLRSDVVFQRH